MSPPLENSEYYVAIQVAPVEATLEQDLWTTAQTFGTQFLNQESIMNYMARSEIAIEGFNSLFSLVGAKIADRSLTDPWQCAPALISCFGTFGGPDFPNEYGKFRVSDVNVGVSLGAFGPHPALFTFTYQGTFYISLSYAEPIMQTARAERLLGSLLAQIAAVL